MGNNPLTLALPKGRLFDQAIQYFDLHGLKISVEERKLVAHDEKGLLQIFLVKNSDLPTYVAHGIAGLGICGSDVLHESISRFFRLLELPFGTTRMCLAARADQNPQAEKHRLKVATKFPRFTRNYFHSRGIPVEIIKLNGSVELAPLLGLAPYIVDLVETGSTLKANNIKVIENLENIVVYLIANPAYYKVHYPEVDRFIELLRNSA